ncbi:MAG: pantetheine-phosphate adenylyltransferase [Candidatus Symbiodolus clandestinus]
MTTILYPGTFDPLTNGHLDVIQRAARIFQSVIVAIAESNEKQPLFSLAERVELAKSVTQHLVNVQIISFTGLLVHCLAQQKTALLLRGVRNSSEFERELALANLNQQQRLEVETLLLPPAVQWLFVSSSRVKEVARHGGSVSAWVPPAIAKALAIKFTG